MTYDDRNDGRERNICGGRVIGIRCGKTLRRGEVVCNSCQEWVISHLCATGEGRRRLTELLGEHVLAEYRGEKLREEQARKDAEAAARAATVAAQRQEEVGYVVYYARLGTNHIKIGTTNNLLRRMTELRVVNPANLLAVEPGGYRLETQRHSQFDKWRYAKRKEDFGESQDLLEHIDMIRTIHGNPWELAETSLQQ